ncbi:JAB domain-containing protein [Limibacter armeniacum]|uniref:JAB domain-containing protein n=1 Tax=Limibacter armeniacum TaxID=466084 RepID=UPI002FE5F1F3
MKIAEIKVSFKEQIQVKDTPIISSSKDAFNCFWQSWNHDEIEMRESFYLMLLNRANHVKGIMEVFKGGVSSTPIDAKLIFSIALKTLSSGIIVAHNHPSCSLTPSQPDIQITRKLREGGKLLDISVLDHLIITPEQKFYSFADEGMM